MNIKIKQNLAKAILQILCQKRLIGEIERTKIVAELSAKPLD